MKPKPKILIRGAQHPFSPNVGCIECKGMNIKINPRKVTCLDCGVSIPREEYEDFIEKKKAEREEIKNGQNV